MALFSTADLPPEFQANPQDPTRPVKCRHGKAHCLTCTREANAKMNLDVPA